MKISCGTSNQEFRCGTPELAFCKKHSGSRCQCRRIQHHGDGTPEWSETVCIPDIRTGPAETDGAFPEAGEVGSAASLVG